MEGQRAKLIVVVIVSVVLAFTCLNALVRKIKSINEPDPRAYKISNAEYLLATDDVEAKVARVLYVNLDYDAVIFIGAFKNRAGAPLFTNIQGEVSAQQFQDIYGSASGTIVRVGEGDKALYGVARCEKGEWRQARDNFWQQWEVQKQAFLEDRALRHGKD